MNTNNKTLADVQPGGMVRLATVPYDRARDLLGDAYNAGTHGIGYSQQAMELHDAIIPTQPSPGGQDALRAPLPGVVGEVWRLVDPAGRQFGELYDSEWHASAAQLRYSGELPFTVQRLELVAARQPVGEPIGYLIYSDNPEVGRYFNEYPSDVFKSRPIYEGTSEVYAAQTAQAVDLGQFRRPIEEWRSDMEQWVEGHGDYDGVFAKDIAEANRLLALIDSQAVGK